MHSSNQEQLGQRRGRSEALVATLEQLQRLDPSGKRHQHPSRGQAVPGWLLMRFLMSGQVAPQPDMQKPATACRRRQDSESQMTVGRAGGEAQEWEQSSARCGSLVGGIGGPCLSEDDRWRGVTLGPPSIAMARRALAML